MPQYAALSGVKEDDSETGSSIEWSSAGNNGAGTNIAAASGTDEEVWEANGNKWKETREGWNYRSTAEEVE